MDAPAPWTPVLPAAGILAEVQPFHGLHQRHAAREQVEGQQCTRGGGLRVDHQERPHLEPLDPRQDGLHPWEGPRLRGRRLRAAPGQRERLRLVPSRHALGEARRPPRHHLHLPEVRSRDQPAQPRPAGVQRLRAGHLRGRGPEPRVPAMRGGRVPEQHGEQRLRGLRTSHDHTGPRLHKRLGLHLPRRLLRPTPAGALCALRAVPRGDDLQAGQR
mmetsp:Transcript_55246/g.161211  ORF Transcript_55246/g.161211 Transcript_55246/m.161211 type:complete len:216 (-) Transcript_55246:1978-2625(-)